MNIAILSTGPDYGDPIGSRIFQSPYILVFNRKTFRYDILRNPLSREDTMQNTIDFILLLIRKKVTNVLVQHCTGDLRTLLGNHGINVIESIAGTVGDVMERLRRISLDDTQVIPVRNEVFRG